MVTQENAPASVPKELVDIIITQFYRVYNDLGYGFLEKVYKNAMYFCIDRFRTEVRSREKHKSVP